MNKELRLGNYVMANNDIFIINSICYEPMFKKIHVTVVKKFGDIPIAVVGFEPKPVILTEELLLKCGFKEKRMCSQHWFIKTNKKFAFLTNDIGPDGYSEKLEFVYVVLRDFSYEIIFVKYLHQLQNLYFALTGEELTINLT